MEKWKKVEVSKEKQWKIKIWIKKWRESEHFQRIANIAITFRLGFLYFGIK